MHQPNRLHVGRLRTLAVAPFAFALISFAGSGLCAQEGAPATSTQVEPHSSKWDYPKELKVPEGSRTHIVQKGDTLWDLAGKYLGNPYAWPQIWENNQWIKDPHWIYPGDPLIIDLTKGVAQGAPEAVGDLQPDQRRIDSSVLRRPELGFSFQDFLQLPFIVSNGADAYLKSQGAFTITSNLRDDRQNLAEGETIYVNGGSEQGIKAGDRFLVLKVVGRKFVHPLQPKNKMGDILQQVGIVRITTAQAKGSVAIIERCMDSVQKGDHLVRFIEPANIPLQLRTDTADPVKIAANSGVVVWSRDNHMNTANGDMTIIDKGAEDGLKVGDVLLAARTTTFSVGSDGQKKPPTDSTTHYLAQVLVVKTEAKTATCRVLRSNEELRIGDTITR
ncbi:MAG TPA: LysM peptidoglycan-binding domain-containing protein [Geothrix sp.]|nr:LysM peptidoglycan-binding domain-containing protein [Geothrix sp.]